MPRLTFLGHSAFIVEGQNGSIVIDPFLTGNPTAKKTPDQIKVDHVLLTHGHGDHTGDGIEIAKANKAVIIAPFELANYCANQGAQVHQMHIGGSRVFPFGKVKLTIAHHGSATSDGTYTGNPCGFLITMDNKTFYHSGDTGLFYDMKLIGDMNNIDVAVLPIGDNFTMGIDDAVKAAEFLQAKMYIPMHYNTFDIIKTEPQEFVNKVKGLGLNSQILSIDETYEY